MKRARALGVLAVALLILLAACGRQDGAGDDCGAATATSAASSTAYQMTEDPSAAASFWTDKRIHDAEPVPMPTEESPKNCR